MLPIHASVFGDAASVPCDSARLNQLIEGGRTINDRMHDARRPVKRRAFEIASINPIKSTAARCDQCLDVFAAMVDAIAGG